jgi:hypothetical protein
MIEESQAATLCQKGVAGRSSKLSPVNRAHPLESVALMTMMADLGVPLASLRATSPSVVDGNER